ncbi:hypothetical protein IFM12276_31680 [Nocardia sputorum]|uniref:Uncharacterized protein n=1 Tax=Nocardia sputorum TaxID=2984338 RepID=A0ABM8CYP8_9NOCA|nr:hypothetical protein IFM12276_31680 [Nocardia sputorum]
MDINTGVSGDLVAASVVIAANLVWIRNPTAATVEAPGHRHGRDVLNLIQLAAAGQLLIRLRSIRLGTVTEAMTYAGQMD